MEDEKIKAIRNWPELQSVRDIQVFLGFTNFYRRFIRNFGRIVAPLTSMLRITNESTRDEAQSTQAENQDVLGAVGRVDSSRNIKNLSTVTKLTKSKKSDLPKASFTKVNFFSTDFLTLKAKKAFIYLQKAFTATLIFRPFDPECHIRI